MARRPLETPRPTRTLVVTQDRVDAMMRSVQALVQRELLVGIPASSAPRTPEEGEAPIDNATLGYIHEFGAPGANIPARPFLVPGLQAARGRIGRRLQRAAEAAMDGRTDAVDAEYDAAGLIAQNAVRQRISEGPFVPLAPATLARRKSRKPPRMGERPLIDTGQLRRSITYVVRTRRNDE